MVAMILAAGRGMRLRPLSDSLPKALLPFHGKPIIHYTIEWLHHYRFNEVLINLHHLGDQIKDDLRNGEKFGVKIHYSEEPSLLGTAGGIRHAIRHMPNRPLLVVNSDFITSIDLGKFLRFHQRKGGLATLVLKRNPNPKRYRNVAIDAQNRLRDILDRHSNEDPNLKRYLFTGIQMIEPILIEEIPEGVSHLTDLYSKAIQEQKILYGYPTEEFWLDLGTLPQYRHAQQTWNRDLLPSYSKRPP